MRSRFRLQLDVVLGTEAVPGVIEAAKQCYARGGNAATVNEQGVARTAPAEEPIDGIEDALIELLERNPLLANANVEFEGVACRSASASPETRPFAEDREPCMEAGVSPDDVLEADDTKNDLDQFETGLYLCRWPNGDFSLVKADDRNDAVVQLDEWADAEPAWLIPMDTFMVDFRLNDRGEIELTELGEETAGVILDKCYPELDRVLSGDDVLKHLGGKRNREAVKKILTAVEHERKRLGHVQREGTRAKTAIGRELQERLGTVGPVADHYAQMAASEILRTKGGGERKT